MKIILVIATFLALITNNAFGYSYQKKIFDSHIIHIIRLNPKEYNTEIIKANNGNIGRETVASMAQKSNASIAINAGFFEIGGQDDGKASGTLIINGKAYNRKKLVQPLVIIKKGALEIQKLDPQIYDNQCISCVSGIPLLLENGKIPEELFHKNSEFYLKPHARTAVGIDNNQKIIIVLAEHRYIKDITSISVGELQSLMNTKGSIFAKKYNKQDAGNITFNELKQILRDEFTPKTGTKGLTILELAKLMQDLGCKNAINLDGGGSSTLWVNGKVINNAFGDNDESSGEKITRPVSDAIIFKKK